MKKTSRRVVSIVLALLMVLTIMPMVNIKAKAATGVEDFVARCYSVALGRAGDEGGINYWVGEINGKKRTGVDVVYNFIFSEEYTNQKTSNEKFVNDLYTMFMGRPADQSGYDYWCGQLKEGKTRQERIFSQDLLIHRNSMRHVRIMVLQLASIQIQFHCHS